LDHKKLPATDGKDGNGHEVQWSGNCKVVNKYNSCEIKFCNCKMIQHKPRQVGLSEILGNPQNPLIIIYHHVPYEMAKNDIK